MDKPTLSSSYNKKVYDNFLIHWKYVKREKIKGARKGENQWRYWYKGDDTSKSSSSNLVDKGKNALLSFIDDLITTPSEKEAEEKAKKEAEEKDRKEAERKAKIAAEKAKKEAEEKVRKEAERKAKIAAEKAKKEAEEKVKKEAEERAKKEEEALNEVFDESWMDNSITLSDIPTIAHSETPLETQEQINPNYEEGLDLSYGYNCAICSLAYDMRRKGYDVEAGPMPFISSKTGEVFYDDFDIIDMMSAEEDEYFLYGVNTTTSTKTGQASWYKDTSPSDYITIDEICDQYKIANDGSDTSVDKAIEAAKSEMLKCGNGSYGNIDIGWKNGSHHSVIWEVSNGEVTIRDCQKNENYPISDFSGYITDISFLRTDNRELSDKAARLVKTKR